MLSSYFKIKILVTCREYSTLGPKGLYLCLMVLKLKRMTALFVKKRSEKQKHVIDVTVVLLGEIKFVIINKLIMRVIKFFLMFLFYKKKKNQCTLHKIAPRNLILMEASYC